MYDTRYFDMQVTKIYIVLNQIMKYKKTLCKKCNKIIVLKKIIKYKKTTF
jgi:hypothetical protein